MLKNMGIPLRHTPNLITMRVLPFPSLLALIERGQSTIQICQLGNAGELPEVVKSHQALMKVRVWVIPRSLQAVARVYFGLGLEHGMRNVEKRLKTAVPELGRNRSDLS